MKKATALVLGLFLTTFGLKATENAPVETFGNFYDGNSYIFVEGGVEFSVFPDGQFDFVYLGNQAAGVNVNVNTPGVNISFNAGYDYDAYVQYDDYGAVIQIEDVPIFYDHFGRITQAGDVDIRYTNRRIVRVGGLRVFYNNAGYFDYCTGYISPFYRTYVYRPWHVFYARPFFNSCIVYDYPYRQFYTPVRYSYAYHTRYYRTGRYSYINGRRDFYRPGSRIHYRNGRTAINRDYNPNRRNTAISRSGRGSTNRGDINRRGNVSSRGDVSRNGRGNTSRGGINQRGNVSKRGDVARTGTQPRSGREIKERATRPTSRGNRGTVSRSDNSKKRTTTTRPSNRRGEVAQNRTQRSGNRSGNNVKRSVTKRNNTSVKRGAPQKRSSSVQKRSSSNTRKANTSRGGNYKKSTSNRSRSNATKKSSTSRSRGSAPRRGRGL